VKGDLVKLFEGRLNALRAPGDGRPAVIHVQDVHAAARKIAELCRNVPSDEIIWQDDRSAAPPPSPSPRPPRDYAVGITGASALIASTGSVILELRAAADAYPSLLVDTHLVVAGRNQLLPDLPTFYQRVSDRCDAGARLPVQVCVTGCSRTADIEKMLVVPAHGPRQIRVLLCETPIDWQALRRFICESRSDDSQ
jgi:hypothetical protein